MIFAQILARHLCNLFGHKERRLRKGEPITIRKGDTGELIGIQDGQTTAKQFRICDRCSRLRAVKSRKKGAAQ